MSSENDFEGGVLHFDDESLIVSSAQSYLRRIQRGTGEVQQFWESFGEIFLEAWPHVVVTPNPHTANYIGPRVLDLSSMQLGPAVERLGRGGDACMMDRHYLCLASSRYCGCINSSSGKITWQSDELELTGDSSELSIMDGRLFMQLEGRVQCFQGS